MILITINLNWPLKKELKRDVLYNQLVPSSQDLKKHKRIKKDCYFGVHADYNWFVGDYYTLRNRFYSFY